MSIRSKLMQVLPRTPTGCLLLLVAGAASADVTVDAVPAGPIGGSEVLNLAVSLVAVVGAILLVGWFYSRMQGGMGRDNGAINIVATRPIGPKERILVVEIADKQLVIGMTASHVQTLHVFESHVVTDTVPLPTNGFSERLRAAIRGVGK